MKGKKIGKRITSWMLTFVMVLSLVMVPAGRVEAADIELSYTAGSQTVTGIAADANGNYTMNIDLGNTSGCTDISQLESAGITKLQVTYKITSCTQVSGADFGVQPFVNAKNNWKGNWVNASADGNAHTVELDLTQFYSSSGELWNFGVQFAGISSITYEITSAKLIKSSSESGGSSENGGADIEEVGTTSANVTATYDSTGSKPSDNYYEYSFTISNHSGSTINDWVIVATLEKDASNVNDNSSWSEVNAKGSGSTIYIYPITSKKSATITNGSSVSYSKIGYAGGAISSVTVYYSTNSGAFSDVLDNVSGGTAGDSTTDLGLDIKYNYAKLLQYSLYIYDANMCGSDVNENCALNWRGDCHTGDYSGTYSRDLSGGYHDAGDHVKFGLPQAYAAATLGISYAEFKDAFTELGQDAHMKVIMDRFIEYFKKCTVMDSNGNVQTFCYQVGNGDADHAYWGTPEAQGGRNEYIYFTNSTYPCTDIVALTAAAMAIYSYNYNDAESLTYAKALLAYAESMSPKASGGAPGTVGSQNYYYGDTYKDDLALASGWIYKASSARNASDAATYNTKYNNYMSSASNGWTHCWNEVWAAAYLVGDKNTDLAALINGRKSATTPQGYVYVDAWGSARYNTALQMLALAYDKNTNTSTYATWATGQMKYLLGNNKTKRCYVVGYNDNSSKYPHHRAASGYTDVNANATTTMKHVVLGALVGGPGGSDDYSDVANNYQYNEISIDYNAGLVGAAAGLYLLNKDNEDQYLITAGSEEAVAGVKTYYGSTSSTTVAVESVTLDATDITLTVGDSQKLIATVLPEDATNKTVTWSSSNTSVATVSGGTIKAVKAGTATITAKAGGKSATCKVTVKNPPVANLQILHNNAVASEMQCRSIEYGNGVLTSNNIVISNIGDAAASAVFAKMDKGNSIFNISAVSNETIAVGGSKTIYITPVSGLQAGTYKDNLIVTYNTNKTITIPVSITVTKKAITVKANNQTKVYGAENPDLTGQYTVEGLVAGDTLNVTLSHVASQTSSVGDYEIRISVASNPNYEITTVKGTLTVTPKPITDITFPTATDIEVGDALNASKLSGGDTTFGTYAWKDAMQELSRGPHNVDVVLKLSNLALRNYSFTGVAGYDVTAGTITKSISVNVLRAGLPKVTFPTATDLQYGQKLSESKLVGGSTEYGTFRWEDATVTMTEADVNNGMYSGNVVFEWSAEKKDEYGILNTDEDATITKTVTVKVTKADRTDTPATASLALRTASSIKLQPVNGVQYSLDNSRWQDSAEFTGLASFTAYKVYTRYKETATHKAGPSNGTALQVYTLVSDPYTIDVSKVTNANYMDALRTISNGTESATTATYVGGVLTLSSADKTYTITGSNNDVTVKAPYGNANIILSNATIKTLDVSNATSAVIRVSGNSTVGSIISTSNNEVEITGSGTLNATQIIVSGSLVLDGPNVVVDASEVGGAAITGNQIIIQNSTVTATGGSGASAIETTGENGSLTIKDAFVEVNVDEDSDKSPITSDNITLAGDNTVSSSTGTDNIYSSTPKDENGNVLATYTVTFLDADGKTELDSVTVYSGGKITLPEIEEEAGYVLTWKNKNTSQTYKPKASFTVTGNVTFVVNKQKILVTKITLDSTAETIEVGDGVALAETVEPANAFDTSVTWSSSNAAVATVTQDGEVTGVAMGTAIITAKAKDGSGKSATCKVTVVEGEPEEVAVEKIKITGATKKVAPGKKLKLNATVYPSNATNQQIKWKVSNKKYATVNSKGVVTTKKSAKGKKVTVTAYSAEDNSIKGTYKISVMKNPVKKIKLSAKTKVIKRGKSVTIKAKFTPSSGISKELTWTSSNKKVATVNSKGKVTGKKKGTVKITAKAKDGSGKKATIKIKVK